jgi:hypothetical protein
MYFGKRVPSFGSDTAYSVFRFRGFPRRCFLPLFLIPLFTEIFAAVGTRRWLPFPLIPWWRARYASPNCRRRWVLGSPLPARDKACVNAVETFCVACQKKFKVTPSSRKVILTVFWDHKGIPLTAFQPQGRTINADSYCNILRKLREAIQRKPPGLTRPGKSPPGSDSCPKTFMLLVFRGLWKDGTSASMHREIMLRNKSIFQISTLVCLMSRSIYI